MKKNFLVFLILVFAFLSFGFSWKKKQDPILYLTPYPIGETGSYDNKIEPVNVFRLGDRIYFTIYVPEGFKSDYIKYQIVKQDDNAHIGGYTRIRNVTKRVNNKNYYTDYFTISKTGQYYIQIFDIQNVHQWLAIGVFRVVEN